MSTTFEKTWQLIQNQTMSDTSGVINNSKNMWWWLKSFLKGDIALLNNSGAALTSYAGLWTCYYSCDGVNVGTAGDGYDRWGVQGTTTANSGSAASLVAGATITGAIRITGVTGLGSSLGNYLTITSATTSANNSPTQTPFKIVKVNSATDVEIYNPLGVTGDANNGSIVWAERGAYTAPTFGNVATGTVAVAGPLQYSATTHSWFVLKSPPTLGPYYLIIDLLSSTIGSFYLSLSKTAPTGGTTSARPTAVDEIQMTNWQNIAFTNGGSTANRAHGGLSTDGYFWMAASVDAIGYRSFMMFQTLTEAKSTDSYPAYFYFSGASILPVIANINSASYGGMKSRSGAISLGAYGTCPAASTSSTGVFNLMVGPDFTDSSYGDFPIYIYITTVGYKSIRGRLMDIRHAPTLLVNGVVESSVATPSSMTIGNIWVPCYTAPVL